MMILLYCSYLQGRWTVEEYLIHMVLVCINVHTHMANIMTSSIFSSVQFFAICIFVGGQSFKFVKICTHQKFPTKQYMVTCSTCTKQIRIRVSYRRISNHSYTLLICTHNPPPPPPPPISENDDNLCSLIDLYK